VWLWLCSIHSAICVECVLSVYCRKVQWHEALSWDVLCNSDRRRRAMSTSRYCNIGCWTEVHTQRGCSEYCVLTCCLYVHDRLIFCLSVMSLCPVIRCVRQSLAVSCYSLVLQLDTSQWYTVCPSSILCCQHSATVATCWQHSSSVVHPIRETMVAGQLFITVAVFLFR